MSIYLFVYEYICVYFTSDYSYMNMTVGDSDNGGDGCGGKDGGSSVGGHGGEGGGGHGGGRHSDGGGGGGGEDGSGSNGGQRTHEKHKELYNFLRVALLEKRKTHFQIQFPSQNLPLKRLHLYVYIKFILIRI